MLMLDVSILVPPFTGPRILFQTTAQPIPMAVTNSRLRGRLNPTTNWNKCKNSEC